MVVTKPLPCLAAVLCIVALAGAARAQDRSDNWLKRLFQPSATGSVPAAAAGTPEWSGQPGASGDPRMTVDAIREAAAAFGRLDGLVNNASSFYATPMGAIGEREWNDLIGTNLRAPLFLAQAAAPRLAAGGRPSARAS